MKMRFWKMKLRKIRIFDFSVIALSSNHVICHDYDRASYALSQHIHFRYAFRHKALAGLDVARFSAIN